MTIYILIALLLILIAAVALFVRRQNRLTPEKPPREVPADCCGSHAVCERDSLLSSTEEIIYFDDEELDALSGIPADEMTDQQVKMIEDVFFTLREQDVAGWLRSIQLRRIELPQFIRDEAFLVVAERREHTAALYAEKHGDKTAPAK